MSIPNSSYPHRDLHILGTPDVHTKVKIAQPMKVVFFDSEQAPAYGRCGYRPDIIHGIVEVFPREVMPFEEKIPIEPASSDQCGAVVEIDSFDHIDHWGHDHIGLLHYAGEQRFEPHLVHFAVTIEEDQDLKIAGMLIWALGRLMCVLEMLVGH